MLTMQAHGMRKGSQVLGQDGVWVLCRSLAARLSARVSELVLSEQQARMALPVTAQPILDGPSVAALRERIVALEAHVQEKEQVYSHSTVAYEQG